MFQLEIKLLRDALNALADAESRYEASALALDESTERDVIQAAFHVATHEAATTIGFALNDIETLIRRLEIQAEHSDFTAEQFQFIVSTPRSPEMVGQLLDDSAMTRSIRSPRFLPS